MTWCPRQIPKRGKLLLIISLVVSITFSRGFGSPGPFERKKPFGLNLSNSLNSVL